MTEDQQTPETDTKDENFAELMGPLLDKLILANTVAGNIDHLAAAIDFMDAVKDLEAKGVKGAKACREAAELAGHQATTRRWAGKARYRLKAKTGSVIVIPAVYSNKTEDGSYQLQLWVDLPLDDLIMQIAALAKQEATLADRVEVMRYGLELARKHRVTTARQGFAAEGVDLVSVGVG